MAPMESFIHYNAFSKVTEGVKESYSTPAYFSSLQDEYRKIRNGIGLVDYSYYGKFQISGFPALDFLNYINFSDVSRLAIGRAMSSLILKQDGTILCDAYIINQGDSYLLLTEGIDSMEVLVALEENNTSLSGKAVIQDLTRDLALIGLDGPFSWELLKEFIGLKVIGIRYLTTLANEIIEGIHMNIHRAGKTGEYGFLLQIPSDQTQRVWELLLERGVNFDLQPCGYKTVDLCKLENRFINIHREGQLASNPLELNLRVLVSREKGNYLGKEQIQRALENGIQKKLIGILSLEKEIPIEADSQVLYQDKLIGSVVNSNYSYTLEKWIGIAYLNPDYAYVGLDYTCRKGSDEKQVRTVSSPFIFNRSLTVRPQEDSYSNKRQIN